MSVERRQTKRTAFCRGCDKSIHRDTEKVFVTHSYVNRGQHIYICDDCIDEYLVLRHED